MNEEIKEIVEYYNLKNGKNHDYETATIQKMMTSILNTRQKEDLLKMIDNNVGVKFYDLFSNYNIERYFEQKPSKLEEKGPEMTLGLIEKALAKVIFDEYVPQVSRKAEQELKDFIKREYGVINRKIIYEIPERGKLEEVTHEKFEEVLKFVELNEPVMLVGPAGTGKNVICKQIAKILNLEFYFSNAVTQEYKLTGFIDANGNYQETQFYKAFKNGGVFMLDEIDASIPEVLIILNAAIANRYFDFPNGKIEAHPDFRVIAAGNTFGQGASYTYVGRNQLDGASLDRFALVNVDYSPKIEESLTNDQELITFIREFRKACNDAGINHIASYRSITRIDKMMKVSNDLTEILRSCLTKNLEKDDINQIIRNMSEGKFKKALCQI